jgi:hypothetical protein
MGVYTEVREPTGEECSQRADIDGIGQACWYPQMGGYVAKCVIVSLGHCFDAFVWHDGTFPFDSKQVCDAEWGDGKTRQPAKIHHCDPAQFMQFGEEVQEYIDRCNAAEGQ